MDARFVPIFVAACLLAAGCHPNGSLSSAQPPAVSPQNEAAAANALFLNQKTFDPWQFRVFANDNPAIPAYITDGETSSLVIVTNIGTKVQAFQAGHYVGGQLQPINEQVLDERLDDVDGLALNIQTGEFDVVHDHGGHMRPITGRKNHDWQKIWQTSDIIITGDPEAQQVTHANLFYLLSSTYPGSDHSIPPMGLSSNLYGGHIFWDAEIFMLPALIVQHPEYAKSIIDYRFKLLGQAKKNAAAHGYKGAEYPWESADTGVEMVGGEFAKERHVTADVAWAAWQYYQWTGDKNYLKTEGWPIMQACADYWLSRITKGIGTDYAYHINGVVGPDETAGVVNDDAWTNGVVAEVFREATEAQKILDAWPSNAERWSEAAMHLDLPFDQARGVVGESSKPLTDHFAAKQADTLLLLYPLQRAALAPLEDEPMLDFYIAHTIKNGPAMTASMESVIAARMGRGQQSLDLFHDSYRPFLRGPWDAFAEKRTSNRVYFCTGMGGCLQSVLYGFAGLNLSGLGTQIAGELYADPHLPPGWSGLTVKGVKYQGKTYDVAIGPGNTVSVTHP